jgi:hypothetical protein
VIDRGRGREAGSVGDGEGLWLDSNPTLLCYD